MDKVIFLDIDGVLNTRLWGGQSSFDRDAVANLTEIIARTEAVIVISSSWKCLELEEIRRLWQDNKLPGKVIDITPDSVSDDVLLNTNLDDLDSFYIRGNEINEWLSLNKDEVSHYVILDDSNYFLPDQLNHLVKTDPAKGLSSTDKELAIAILS